MVQSSLQSSKGIGTVFIIAQLWAVGIHAGVITKRNPLATTTNIALMSSDLFDATVSTDINKLTVSTMEPTTSTKFENKEQNNGRRNKNEETTIMAISEESSTMIYSGIDEIVGMETTSLPSIKIENENKSRRKIDSNSFKEEEENNVLSTTDGVTVAQESYVLNSVDTNSSQDGYQTTFSTIFSTQSSEITNYNNSGSTNDIIKNEEEIKDFTTTHSLRPLTVQTNSVNNSSSYINLPTTTTAMPSSVDFFPLTTPTFNTVNNVLEEFNEIISTTTTPTKPASEKKGKFLHDNSTNTNKLNLPDASEVWTLVGMKAIPSKPPQPPSYEKQKNVEKANVNNSIAANSKEKNLLDWKQIMMNGDFAGKTENNFIENNAVASKINIFDVDQKQESEVKETYVNIFPTISNTTPQETKIATTTQIPPSIDADSRGSNGELLLFQSALVTAPTNFKRASEKAETLATATTVRTTILREDSVHSPSLSHQVERETNLVIEENSATRKSTTSENIKSDEQTPPPTHLPLGLTTEYSFHNELNIITLPSTKTTIVVDNSALNSATEVLTTTTETTATTPEYVQNVTLHRRQPLPAHNVSTVFQSPPPSTIASRNNSYNESTLKTMNNNYGSDDFEQTTANANDVGEEATLDLHSSTKTTTTVSSSETSTVSTIAYNTLAYNDELDIITLGGGTNFAGNNTTTQSAITTTVPKNLESLTSPNTRTLVSVITKKVHEISTDLDTSERTPTSSSTTQKSLVTEINTAQAVTSPSSWDEEEEETLTLTTGTILTTIVPILLQKTTTSSNRSSPSATTIFPTSQSTTDNVAYSTDASGAATTERDGASSDMDFSDNPLYKTRTTTSSELTEEANYVEPLLVPTSTTTTTMETNTVSTSTEAAAIPTTSSSIELEDLTTTTTIIAAVMSSNLTDSTLELITPITVASSTVTSQPSTVTVPKIEIAEGDTSTSTTIDSILPITLETRTTHKLGIAIDDPLLNHRNHTEMDVNIIIAISVSVIGIIALVLLVGFLYVVRKRQKQLSYGHRCRPVSLDAYSLDNVSVYNSVRRKNVARSSKRSYGNVAFDDPALRHNNLNATELSKFSERKSAIFEEFKYVPQIIARPDEVPTGCEDKNRYANVIPIPETRVSLQQQNSDEKTEYINANYVRGPKDSPNYYIACQAPLESTVVDFWRMIWEQKSRVIIQATDLVENGIEKCAEYLPPSVTLDNHISFGDFQITLKNREVKDKYAISTIILKHSVENLSRELTHYWYRWPETGVPSEEAPIIAMLLEARSSLKSYAVEIANEMREKSATLQLVDKKSSQDAENKRNGSALNGNGETDLNLSSDRLKIAASAQGPLTVHCSPGTGRTGTIIACDIAVRSLETPKRSVDIPQIVYYVRRGRASAVQTKEQYEFIYKIANMYATKITHVSTDN